MCLIKLYKPLRRLKRAMLLFVRLVEGRLLLSEVFVFEGTVHASKAKEVSERS